MSWSASASNVAYDAVVETIEGLSLPETLNPPATPEMEAQLAAAKAAAKAIFEAGVVGGPEDGPFSVSLVGHANAGHARTPGWGTDMVYVQVTQAYFEPPKPDGAGG